MNIIFHLILDNGGTIEFPSNGNVEELRCQAYESRIGNADRLNTYTSDALEHVHRYSDHLPDPQDVLQHIDQDQMGDWQHVLTITAILATQSYLEAQVSKDIDTIESAIEEAHVVGYEAYCIHSKCIHGWAAHKSETTLKTGTLYFWESLDNGPNAWLMSVTISGGEQVWLGVAR